MCTFIPCFYVYLCVPPERVVRHDQYLSPVGPGAESVHTAPDLGQPLLHHWQMQDIWIMLMPYLYHPPDAHWKSTFIFFDWGALGLCDSFAWFIDVVRVFHCLLFFSFLFPSYRFPLNMSRIQTANVSPLSSACVCTNGQSFHFKSASVQEPSQWLRSFQLLRILRCSDLYNYFIGGKVFLSTKPPRPTAFSGSSSFIQCQCSWDVFTDSKPERLAILSPICMYLFQHISPAPLFPSVSCSNVRSISLPMQLLFSALLSHLHHSSPCVIHCNWVNILSPQPALQLIPPVHHQTGGAQNEGTRTGGLAGHACTHVHIINSERLGFKIKYI